MDRTTYYQTHSRMRRDARERALKHAQGVIVGSADIAHTAGKVGLTVRREARGNRVVTEPAKVYWRTICDQAPRQRIACELSWAAHYRREAGKAWRGPILKRKAILAAASCIRDARALQTVFARLP